MWLVEGRRRDTHSTLRCEKATALNAVSGTRISEKTNKEKKEGLCFHGRCRRFIYIKVSRNHNPIQSQRHAMRHHERATVTMTRTHEGGHDTTTTWLPIPGWLAGMSIGSKSSQASNPPLHRLYLPLNCGLPWQIHQSEAGWAGN